MTTKLLNKGISCSDVVGGVVVHVRVSEYGGGSEGVVGIRS